MRYQIFTIFLVITITATNAILAAPRPKPGGLSGFTSGSLGKIDPKAAALEVQILKAINQARQKAQQQNLSLDEQLRQFIRNEAEIAATDGVDINAAIVRFKLKGLATDYYRLQYGFGTKASLIVEQLLAQAQSKEILLGDFTRVGIGAFWVPIDKPTFQVALIFVLDPDPHDGQPGLSPSQTDPIVAQAQETIRSCYDAALEDMPDLKGDLLLQIVIGPQGTVINSKMLKSLGNRGFDACALAVVNRLKFPVPYKNKSVTLNQPMHFTPSVGYEKVGKLTNSQINGSFAIANNDFRACYDRRLKEKPDLAGFIIVKLNIEADGSVAKANVEEDTLADAEFTACLLKRIETLHFPRPEFKAGLEISYRLDFRP
ncbi:MAG: energy transducer TonB [Deltaproteobacteria bacterium]|nr:energy transducer TonB [Deltaproteobacteria bacterium]